MGLAETLGAVEGKVKEVQKLQSDFDKSEKDLKTAGDKLAKAQSELQSLRNTVHDALGSFVGDNRVRQTN